ncbi:MAG: hypothetical protein M5U01_10095 [Ardenticatenaceae bacterium]|nr:hypothetical protein [Ardenticatenaceae bacterium]
MVAVVQCDWCGGAIADASVAVYEWQEDDWFQSGRVFFAHAACSQTTWRGTTRWQARALPELARLFQPPV